MNRKRLALLALVVAVFLSGCGVFGGGEIDEDDLLGDQEYDWESNATATYDLDVSSDSYTAVIEVEDRETLEVYQENRLRSNSPLSIGDLKFRFTNGTVVNATHDGLDASDGSDETEIRLPAEDGTVAFTAERSGKSWSTPVYVDGTHEVRLPEDTDVGIPLLSRVSPGADEQTTTEEGRTVLRWDDAEEGDSISVRYYLIRDLYIFGTLFAIAISLGAGGLLYYYRQIKRAREKREAVGLDVEEEDTDLDDGPPPGM